MPPSKRTKRTMDSLAAASAAPSSVPSSSSSKLLSSGGGGAPSLPSKRRQVKVAADADEVLAKCRRLRDSLRMKAMRRSEDGRGSDSDDDDDDAWGFGSDSDDLAGTTKRRAASKASSAKSSDADPTGGGDARKKLKTQQLSLAEVRKASADGKKQIVEVVEMSSTEVMEGIENVAVAAARQVLAKRGFQLDIPCEWRSFDRSVWGG